MTPIGASLEREAKSNFLVISIALFLSASAFGPVKVPGTPISLANAALVLLTAAVLRCPPSRLSAYIGALFLGMSASLDFIFRVYLDQLQDLTYSVNILKLSIFWLAAQSLTEEGGTKNYVRIVSAFAFSLIGSEIFAIFRPDLRMEVYKTTNDFAFDGFSLFRPTGLYGDPNYFAAPLVIAAVLAWECGRRGIFLLCLILVSLTGSRSAIIATLVPIVLAYFRQNNGTPLRAMFAVLAATLATGALFIANSALRGSTGTVESNRERLNLALQGLENISSFSFLQAVYGQPLGRGLSGEPLVVHNTFLQTTTVSFLLGAFLVWVGLRGARAKFPWAFLAIVIEFMFLDVSAYSSLLFIFLIFGVSRPDNGRPPSL